MSKFRTLSGWLLSFFRPGHTPEIRSTIPIDGNAEHGVVKMSVYHTVTTQIDNSDAATQSPENDPLSILRRDCYDTAYAIGFNTRSEVTQTPETLLAGARARARAIAISREVATLKDEQLGKTIVHLEKQLLDHLYDQRTACANIGILRNELAEIPNISYPTTDVTLRWSAIACLIVSFVAPIHDWMPGLLEELRWLLAVAISSVPALAIVYAILPADHENRVALDQQQHQRHQRLGVLVGVLVSIVFVLARLALARTFPDFLMSFAMLLLDVSIVLLLERRASGIEHIRAAWCETETDRQKATARLEASLIELELREELVAQTNQRAFETVKAREVAAALSDVDKLIAIAVEATGSGYEAGVRERIARQGVIPIPKKRGTPHETFKPSHHRHDRRHNVH